VFSASCAEKAAGTAAFLIKVFIQEKVSEPLMGLFQSIQIQFIKGQSLFLWDAGKGIEQMN